MNNSVFALFPSKFSIDRVQPLVEGDSSLQRIVDNSVIGLVTYNMTSRLAMIGIAGYCVYDIFKEML